jgi:hypothetical protein
VSKNYKQWSNENGKSSTTKIVQRNNSERSSATSQCIWIQIFIFVIVRTYAEEENCIPNTENCTFFGQKKAVIHPKIWSP